MSASLRHNAAVSAAKGLCILLMVIGHSGAPESLGRFIYLFHMPCFFFLSGYMFKTGYFTDARRFVMRRLRGLYLPFVKYSFLFIALHLVLQLYGFYGIALNLAALPQHLVKVLTLSTSDQLLGGYWFLKVLLLCSLVSYGGLRAWHTLAPRLAAFAKRKGYASLSLIVNKSKTGG